MKDTALNIAVASAGLRVSCGYPTKGLPNLNYMCVSTGKKKSSRWIWNIKTHVTVLRPIPLKWESSVLISSTVKSHKYSRHNLHFLPSKQFNIFLIQETSVTAKLPRLMAFSMLLESTARTSCQVGKAYLVTCLSSSCISNLPALIAAGRPEMTLTSLRHPILISKPPSIWQLLMTCLHVWGFPKRWTTEQTLKSGTWTRWTSREQKK